MNEVDRLVSAAREVVIALDALIDERPQLAAKVAGSTTVGNHRSELLGAIRAVLQEQIANAEDLARFRIRSMACVERLLQKKEVRTLGQEEK